MARLTGGRASSHVAFLRRQPAEWTADGKSRGYVEADVWEVVCEDCGDNRGPYDKQREDVRRLRGPYTKLEARRVARQHITQDC